MNNDTSFAKVETCLFMEPKHSNPEGNVHGGELMKVMDNVAGIVAIKHSKGTVVTARVDELVFHMPIHVGDIITCVGELAYVGTTSMQVFVTILVHNIKDDVEPKTALTSFFTLVHLKDGKPAKVPQIKPSTPREEELYAMGKKKYDEIKSLN